MSDTVVDAEVIEEPLDVSATVGEAPSTAIVRRERRSEVLKPLDADALIASFGEYQALLQRILTADDWQGAPNRQGSFVKKKGWRKIATAFDLDVKRVSSSVERDALGNPLRAEACYVAIAPSGRSMDGDGYCSVEEPRFSKANGRQKLENDLQATASTRAKNRAISDLVGMGAVSAEETDSEVSPVGIELASPAQLGQFRNALAFMLGTATNSRGVEDVIARLLADYPAGIPRIATRAIGLTAAVAKALRETSEASDDKPLPGSIPLPPLNGSDEQNAAGLRTAGCICPYPLDPQTRDSDCPLATHGICF